MDSDSLCQVDSKCQEDSMYNGFQLDSRSFQMKLLIHCPRSRPPSLVSNALYTFLHFGLCEEGKVLDISNHSELKNCEMVQSHWWLKKGCTPTEKKVKVIFLTFSLKTASVVHVHDHATLLKFDFVGKTYFLSS